MRNLSKFSTFVLLLFAVAPAWAGVDVIADGKTNPEMVTPGAPDGLTIKNNTKTGYVMGGIRFWTKGHEYQNEGWGELKSFDYETRDGRKYHNGVWSTAAWEKTLNPDISKSVTFVQPQWGQPQPTDSLMEPIPLLKIGVCNAPLPYEDAGPITLEELEQLMQNPLYYDEDYRYIDKLGTHGGPFSGGFIDTYVGETQMQLATPSGTVNVNGTDAVFNLEMFNTPLSWMALSMGQEYFGMDQQWMFSVWSKETAWMLNYNGGNWHFALRRNDDGAFGPGEVEATTFMSRAMGYPKFFPYEPCLTDPRSRDVASAIGVCGFSDITFSEKYMRPDYTDGDMAHIVNATIASGLVFWFNYDLLAGSPCVYFKEALLHSTDPMVGLCAMAPIYNLGINSGAESPLLGVSTAKNATCQSFPPGNGDYRTQIVQVAQLWEQASVKAQTDKSQPLVDKWITLADLAVFFFGDEATTITPYNIDGATQKGGLMMHFDIGDAKKKEMWEEMVQAFNMQAAHWGGGKISLRYDWLSLLRIAKKHLDLTRGQVQGEEASKWWSDRAGCSTSPDGSRALDTKYPYVKFQNARQEEDFTVEVVAQDNRPTDWGIERVEWTLNDDWSNFTKQNVTRISGNDKEATFKILLPKAQIPQEGGRMYVRAVDSCGNSVVYNTPIKGMKLPKLNFAYIIDTDGDGNGDRIIVQTEEDPDVNVKLSQATALSYSWPSADNAINGDVGLVKAGTFQIDDKNLSGGVAEGLGGRVEITLPGAVLKKTIADSVGPVIRYASIQERHPNELYVVFSEPIAAISDPALQYLEINGMPAALTALEATGQSWKFTLTEPLDVSRVEAMLDSVRIVPKMISDALGNSAADNNIKVPIMLDKGPLEIASDGFRYLDRNFDGTMDRIEIKFKQPALGRTGTMTLTYRWPIAERSLTSPRYAVKEFKIEGSKLEVDAQNPMLVFYDASKDSLRQYTTYFDRTKEDWGKATLVQKSIIGAIFDQSDELPMIDAMGPIAKYANYGETSLPNRRPDTLSVEFSEPLDTAATALYSSCLFFTKTGSSKTEWRYAHEHPTVKKRYRNQILSVYYEPHLTERPGIGDSLKVVYEDEDGVIHDLAGNRAPALNPWVLINGKIRVQISGGELFVFDGHENIPKDTTLFFESTFDLDSLLSLRAGVGFTISFIDSGEGGREAQRFIYETSIYSNLGGFVRNFSGNFNCRDIEQSGVAALSQACNPEYYPASRKIKVFVPWDYRSHQGKLVGTGAYIQKISIRGSRIEKLEENRTFGVIRKEGKGIPWSISQE